MGELSGASAWHCVQRVAEARRDEYETIREQIREAAVVHVDETGLSLDGEQGWPWTFKTEEAVLYHISSSRGSEVLEAVLGEDFDGQLVNDGWTAYPAFTDAFQRCWAHLREPVVLRKIIGTVRSESGEVVHETLLSLLARWEQQGLNPYDELKRVARPEPT